MPQVLHVIDAASPQATPGTLALLADALDRLGDVRQHVLLLGSSRMGRMAERLKIPVLATVGVPGGKALWGWPRSARALRRIIADKGIDLVHAWSVGAFTLASLAARSVPRVLSVTAPLKPSTVNWLRLLMGETAQAHVLAISNTLRRDLLQGGVPESAVHVLRPGLDQGRIAYSTRAALRRRWGVRDDDTKVVAMVGDPWYELNALDGAMAVGIAGEVFSARAAARPDVVQPNPRLLLHVDQRGRRRAEAMFQPLGLLGRRVIREPSMVRPWDVLPGCDAALAMGHGGGGLTTLWAMAANVPIVAEATYAVSEILEDRHSALLAKPDQPKLLAHRLTQLFEDKLLAWKLRDTARHEAYSFFSRQRYCQGLQSVYENVLAQRPIDLPPLPITGGLRFSGRA